MFQDRNANLIIPKLNKSLRKDQQFISTGIDNRTLGIEYYYCYKDGILTKPVLRFSVLINVFQIDKTMVKYFF